MKKSLAVVLGAALIAANGFAADSTDRPNTYFSAAAVKRIVTEKVVRNYQFSLRSDNDGVVESALAQVAYVKLVNEQQPMELLKKDVNRLVLFGRTPMIRFKAYLTAQVFDSPGLFNNVSVPPCNTCDELFQELSHSLHQALSSDTSRKLVLAE
jgi:hypothetical protein